MGEMRRFENWKGRDYLFIWLRIGTSGRLL
jgi:hypothetical protein